MKLTERKRAALIVAAKDEFIEFGFRAANMSRICERAQTSKRTLYKHFESKELLFSEAINSLVTFQHTKELTLQYQSQLSLEEQLRHHLNDKIEEIYCRIGLPVIKMIVSEFMREPTLINKFLYVTERSDIPLQQWLEEAMEERRLHKGDSKLMVAFIMNQLHGFFLWPQLIANHDKPNTSLQAETVDEIIRVFLCAYGS